MSRLEIVTGEAAARLPAQGVMLQIVRMPPEKYCELEAFIRRTGILKSAALGREILLADQKPPRMARPRERMLERIALGLNASVCSSGELWYGVPPGRSVSNPGPGIGNWNADVLVVGGGPSPKAPQSAPNWPFISSNEYGCAYWLAEQLERAGVPESSLYWMNAYGRAGAGGAPSPTSAAELKRHSWKCVVTLGRDAAEWADKAGLPNICAEHHPAFWWKYRAAKPYPMIDTLNRYLRSL